MSKAVKKDVLKWEAKGRKLHMTTGLGVAIWPSLHKPDTRYDKNGVYKLALRVPEKEPWVQELIAKGTQEREEYEQQERRAQRKRRPLAMCEDFPWKPAMDGEESVPGFLDISFKMNARVEPKDKEPWEQQPAIFDSRGNPVAFGLPIGGGSELKVSSEVRCWNAPKLGGIGISFRLLGVQVFKFVEAFSGDAGSHGFDGEEAESEGFIWDQADDSFPGEPASPDNQPDGPDAKASPDDAEF